MLVFVQKLRSALRAQGVRTAPVPSDSKELHCLRLFAERAYDGELWLLGEGAPSTSDRLNVLLTVERPMVGERPRLERNATALRDVERFASQVLGQGLPASSTPTTTLEAGPYTLELELDGVVGRAQPIAEVVAKVSQSWRTGMLADEIIQFFAPPPSPPDPPSNEAPPDPKPKNDPLVVEEPPAVGLEERVADRLAAFSAVTGTVSTGLVARVSLEGHGGASHRGEVCFDLQTGELAGGLRAELTIAEDVKDLVVRPQEGLVGRIQSAMEDSLAAAGFDDPELDAAYLFFGDVKALDLTRARAILMALRPAGLNLRMGEGRLVARLDGGRVSPAGSSIHDREKATLGAALEVLNLWSSGL